MLDLPQQPRLTEFAISSWLRNIRDNVKRQQTVQGGDTVVSETAYGTKVRNKQNTGFFVRWMGGYAPLSSYKEGDMVEVTSGSYQSGKNDAGGNKVYESRPGIYICVYPVPSFIDPAGFAGSQQYIIDYITSCNQRVTNVVYHPIYPMPAKLPDVLPTGAIQGRYWQLIAFKPVESVVCKDGVTQAVWIHSALSGSL